MTFRLETIAPRDGGPRYDATFLFANHGPEPAYLEIAAPSPTAWMPKNTRSGLGQAMLVIPPAQST